MSTAALDKAHFWQITKVLGAERIENIKVYQIIFVGINVGIFGDNVDFLATGDKTRIFMGLNVTVSSKSITWYFLLFSTPTVPHTIHQTNKKPFYTNKV